MFSRNDLYEASLGILQQATFFDTDNCLVASDVLSLLQQSLSPVAGKWLTSVLSFAESIPATSGNILEVHLDKENNNVDFAARLYTSFDKEIMTGIKHNNYSFPFMPDGFLSLFRQNSDGFAHGIKNVWVEYDAPFTNPPALFFDIRRNKAFCPSKAYDALACVTSALNYRIEEQVVSFVERISRCGLHVVYYGLMFSRENPSLRLTIKGVDARNLTNVLTALGWNGNADALQRLSALYLSKKQKLVLGVDVGSSLLPRIGIEVFDENQTAFINELYHYGQVNNEQADALRSWEQRLVLPNRLRTALSELHGRSVGELHTRINHFKFVLDDTETIKAKAYLYYCF